jgi:hypothetical protein
MSIIEFPSSHKQCIFPIKIKWIEILKQPKVVYNIILQHCGSYNLQDSEFRLQIKSAEPSFVNQQGYVISRYRLIHQLADTILSHTTESLSCWSIDNHSVAMESSFVWCISHK